LQIAESDGTDGGADELEDFAFDGLDHAAHLTIAALGDREFQVGVFAGISNAPDLRGTRGSIAERHTAA